MRKLNNIKLLVYKVLLMRFVQRLVTICHWVNYKGGKHVSTNVLSIGVHINTLL